jgi:uncharacterized membrane protein
MAEPGDPQAPDDHDDLVGFASPASLQGRARTPEAPQPGPESRPEPEPKPSLPEPDLFGASVAASIPVEPEPEPAITPDPSPTPIASVAASIPIEPEPDPAPAGPTPATPTPAMTAPFPAAAAAASTFEPSPEFSRPRREAPAIPGGGMGLYAVYALILFAVPTLGVSAIIGLLAVTGRAGPEDTLAQSHFVYQQRTLWTAVVAVTVGLIFFLVPFGLGPAIMFIAALWLVARGAAGVWALKAGRPIADPRGWWI